MIPSAPVPPFTWALALCLSVAGGGWAKAGHAAFSGDGERLYLLRNDGVLERLDLAGKSRWEILPDVPEKAGPLVDLATSSTDKLLLLHERALAAWDETSKTTKRLCAPPPGWTFRETAEDPRSGRILVLGTKPSPDSAPAFRAWVFRPETEALDRVTTKRLRGMRGIAFTPAGHLVFGSEGDLWFGRIEEEEIVPASEDPQRDAELADPPSRWEPVLEAYRYAPLATRETANTTPSAIGVDGVAIHGDGVYARLTRMGGTGFGYLVRLPLPKVPAAEGEGPEPALAPEKWQSVVRRALDSTEVLGRSNSLEPRLASSRTTKSIFYRLDGQDWLQTGNQPARRIDW